LAGRTIALELYLFGRQKLITMDSINVPAVTQKIILLCLAATRQKYIKPVGRHSVFG
jgi:hypothetical protein